jgi:hypothetical protein
MDARVKPAHDQGSWMRPNSKTVAKPEIGRVRIVEDFLPSPEALVAREDNVKVTLHCRAAVSSSSSARRNRSVSLTSA